jgi:hypothetical protein
LSNLLTEEFAHNPAAKLTIGCKPRQTTILLENSVAPVYS